ncbi:S1 family peptidase [Streptomyces zagrosensis]|uniref:Streptogrisin C n=1 Tax=Streptomyces zagrosensis TaxID=1042984 RepID=A0A7W9V0K0_9ACTN|nr:S1 family peptidase [Streptomyces zagrosensis]MBB5937351.1 streptogrisin C [Streptomyces zagrosensis]
MLRRRGLIAGCAIAMSAFSLTAFPAMADNGSTATPSSAESSTSQVPAGMLKAMERDLGLTPAEAKERIANEYRAATLEPKLRGSLGADFGGSWLAGDSARLVIATTDPADSAAISAAGATAKVVKHSIKELNAAKSSLDRIARTNSTATAPVWYVDVKTNSVVVRASNPAAAHSLVAKSGADSTLVRVVKSAEQPQTFYDVRGGDAYYIGSGSRCSIGFSVTKGTQSGFATAGHCGKAGATTTGYNRVAQGSFQASRFPGADMAWVAVNSQWTVKPWVKGPSGNVTVAGSQQTAVGGSICRSGSTTGWHCGTVQQHNTSVSYPQGTISGVTRTSVCAEPGDSGGSYISGSQAQGVTSGGSGNCSSGGTTYHQPINPILSAYGLRLVTG